MIKSLRFVMAILFALVLVSTNAVAEGHDPLTQGYTPTMTIGASQTLDCSEPCAHGSEMCAQLCAAGTTDLTTQMSMMTRWPSVSIGAIPAGVLLRGRVPAPMLIPPIG